MDDPDRYFRFEETQNAIFNDLEKPVIIYALTDQLLVVERDVFKFVM